MWKVWWFSSTNKCENANVKTWNLFRTNILIKTWLNNLFFPEIKKTTRNSKNWKSWKAAVVVTRQQIPTFLPKIYLNCRTNRAYFPSSIPETRVSCKTLDNLCANEIYLYNASRTFQFLVFMALCSSLRGL